mmetsp:Transcript_46605/g.117356  ORF Transcript_46605/g.117356 Transcript_46605/m.117356 type:complete len:337 (+) Transcript_46605:1508-2518(+)
MMREPYTRASAKDPVLDLLKRTRKVPGGCPIKSLLASSDDRNPTNQVSDKIRRTFTRRPFRGPKPFKISPKRNGLTNPVRELSRMYCNRLSSSNEMSRRYRADRPLMNVPHGTMPFSTPNVDFQNVSASSSWMADEMDSVRPVFIRSRLGRQRLPAQPSPWVADTPCAPPDAPAFVCLPPAPSGDVSCLDSASASVCSTMFSCSMRPRRRLLVRKRVRLPPLFSRCRASRKRFRAVYTDCSTAARDCALSGSLPWKVASAPAWVANCAFSLKAASVSATRMFVVRNSATSSCGFTSDKMEAISRFHCRAWPVSGSPITTAARQLPAVWPSSSNSAC